MVAIRDILHIVARFTKPAQARVTIVTAPSECDDDETPPLAVSRVTTHSETSMRFPKPAARAALLLGAGILFSLAACSPDAATRPAAPNAANASRVATDGAASNADDDLENEGEGLN